MFSCRQAAWLSSQSLDRALTRIERWTLRAHIFLCAECGRLDEQLRSLRRASGQFGDFLNANGHAMPALPDDARQRLAQVVADAARRAD